MTGTTSILNISIPLTSDNVQMLKGTQINTEDIKLIINKGFFGFYGSMTIHRDKTGKLRVIEKHIIEYKE